MIPLCRALERWSPVAATLIVLALCLAGVRSLPAADSDWIPTAETHAWARFGPRAWKEVRVRTDAYHEKGQLQRTSVTTARTRVLRVGLHSFSLCVSTTVEVAGRQFPSDPQELTRDVAPKVESTQVVGDETLIVDGVEYPVQLISLVTVNGTKRETSTLYQCATTSPQTLKRVTTSIDTQSPVLTSHTTVTVTELGHKIDILGEMKCTWSVTTEIKLPDRTVTIQEVNCRDVPGELVSQLIEERNASGELVSRKELELVGYGPGRPRRVFRRR